MPLAEGKPWAEDMPRGEGGFWEAGMPFKEVESPPGGIRPMKGELEAGGMPGFIEGCIPLTWRTPFSEGPGSPSWLVMSGVELIGRPAMVPTGLDAAGACEKPLDAGSRESPM